MGAPVMILMAQPASSRVVAAPPAGIYPAICREAGSRQSAARTAKPSMAELSKQGMSQGATISSVMTLPRESRIATRSMPTGVTLLSIILRASSKVGMKIDSPLIPRLQNWLKEIEQRKVLSRQWVMVLKTFR
jgi:hypothetical protein